MHSLYSETIFVVSYKVHGLYSETTYKVHSAESQLYFEAYKKGAHNL
jgi:hypothetical protein